MTSGLPIITVNETGWNAIRDRMDTLGEECIADAPPGVSPGEVVRVANQAGDFMGVGYFNRMSRLPLRLLSREDRFPDRDFWLNAIRSALKFRHHFYSPEESFRVVFGESDHLPGLIVDKFGEYLSVQVTTAGIELQRDLILDALEDILGPKGIILTCDSLPRKKEGLPLYRQIARGDVPTQILAPIDGVPHWINCIDGHKTGFFLDHRTNREWAAALCSGKRVLDMFCYSGAFGIRAGLNNAQHVDCIDIFEPALALGEQTASLHGIGQTVTFQRAEAFSYLAGTAGRENWDLIFLDPPSFVRGSRRAQRNQTNYRKITMLALGALAQDGILVTSCCSFHVTRTDFIETTQSAFNLQGRNCRIFRVGCQGADHPILPGVEGTDYLKCLFTLADQ